MRRRTVIAGLALSPGLGGVAATASVPRPSSTPVIDSLAMVVTREQNRQFSFTDKASAYFHGRTHTDNNPDWFNGWNIATKRIFHDYRLSVDGLALSRQDTNVVVAPDKIIRSFAKAAETLSMFDGLSVLVLTIGTTGSRVGVALTGDLTDSGTLGPEGVWFSPKEAAGTILLVAPMAPRVRCSLDRVHGVTCAATGGGFYFIHAPTQSQARQLLARVRRNRVALQAARRNRMEALVSGKHALDAGDPDRTKALLWMRLTGDQLIMKQLGTGIYAGLPWFNDYWGRDTFISITGLLFTMGRYDEAAEVFTSFAALQDVNPLSKTFGRVPNRARPDGIEYNSADGTPRFIITLAELVTRSGDIALASRLWPVVKRAIDGVLKNNVDEFGLITHEDADTWMDAKEKGVRAWSPRGNRAVDVQTLWLEALACGRFLHEIVTDEALRQRLHQFDEVWQERTSKAHDKLRLAMTKFEHPLTGHLIDHIRSDGTQDLSVRPNVLFSIGYDRGTGDPTTAQLERDMTQVRDLWQALVYPWGVSTLSQDDPNFYPYHEHWHYYHKDAAYHNGTVWPWLNGIAIQRLLEFNQIEPAWKLFENMNRQALREGAVGSLAECADALPIDGAAWSRRTGTFLQAWSNAEQLRVWQDCFLGFSAASSLQISLVSVRSRLPRSVSDVRFEFQTTAGQVKAHYHINGAQKWRFTWLGDRAAYFNLDVLAEQELRSMVLIQRGWTIEFSVKDGGLASKVFEQNGVAIEDGEGLDVPLPDSAIDNTMPDRLAPRPQQRRAMENRIFANLDFCQPRLAPGLKSLSVRHDPPLTY
jgi:glycogen debranching enzyme